LQADSFGMGARTTSGDNNDGSHQHHPSHPLLQKNSSVGNTSQQLLASASGGASTIYSPVNSFGNASAASHRRGGEPNMLLLGGTEDGRSSSSPTQVLGMMYRSYSGGGGSGLRSEMLDDHSHLRSSMSVGSFGAGPVLSYGRPPSYGGEPGVSSSMQYFNGGGSGDVDRGPHFYVTLRKFRMAFKDCTFLLPGLKVALLEMPESSGNNEGEIAGGAASAVSLVHSICTYTFV
jgi:hypothetical protein